MPFDDNTTFRLASQFVNQTSRHVFLTGKAGTGKTTFLRTIRDTCQKKMAIAAPTGVAAINAGGVTLHSLFQLPFGPFIPRTFKGWDQSGTISDPHSLFKNIRLSANKRDLLQELELLIIDEISMVRADMLDAVDTILRHFRQQPQTPFGGVQVLYIGDLFQLPPVVSREEWELLREYYDSPFFFDAQCIRSSPPVCLELRKVYRQKEASFIDILNNIRNNRATEDDLEQLHFHYQPDFQPSASENYIILTSHNAKAAHINQAELDGLRGKSHSFEASVTGEFNERSFPAEKTLHLKEGAQVMFIKNDKGETRRYFNGKIGRIERISGDKIMVCFPGEKEELVVEKEVWKNIRYNYDREKDKIEEEELGSFSQYPLRLAWAITIHKSQGLTFDKAVIDAGASFAPGQVYVALSRLTNLDGLILHSRIHPASISTDERVVAFTESVLAETAWQNQLLGEQQAYIKQVLTRAFAWDAVEEEFSLLTRGDEGAPGQHSLSLDLPGQLAGVLSRHRETAVKFFRQLDLLLDTLGGEGQQTLQLRVEAAASFFIKSIDLELIGPVKEGAAAAKKSKNNKRQLQTLAGLKTVFERKRRQLEQARQIVSEMAEEIGR
ncbi:MAG: AAA family ATPase [Bacteroidota bacterium]|nr:AAA family ATPase [Bacteroidota bacterium]